MNLEDHVARISPSRAAMWLRCQFAWFQRYVEEWIEPPRAAMVFGDAYDTAASAGLADKQQTGRNPTPDDTADRFAAAWDVKSGTVEEWDEGESPNKLLDQGTKLASKWAEAVAPAVVPQGVQLDLEVPMGSWSIVGRADAHGEAYGESNVVIEHKTAARAWPAGKIHEGDQAGVYAAALGAKSFQVHLGVRGKGEILTYRRAVLPDETEGVRRKMAVVRKSILAAGQAEAFPPNRQSHLCSRRWCGYWRECERTWGGVVKD